MTKSPFADELIDILTKAVSNKIYGSVEIYFENGNITQVTQRIIKKMSSSEKKADVKTNPNLRVKNEPHKDPQISGVRLP